MVIKRVFATDENACKEVGGRLIEVNPAYTSVDAIGVLLAKGIDIHTTSAYLIALRGMKRYSLT
jgi:hypothetical protein